MLEIDLLEISKKLIELESKAPMNEIMNNTNFLIIQYLSNLLIFLR
jgi:hypothetical protein